MTRRGAVATLALAALSAACGGGPFDPSAFPPEIALTVKPDPLIGLPGPGGPAAASQVRFSVTLTENGVGESDVDFINLTLIQREGQTTLFNPEIGTVRFSSDRIAQLAGTNHVAPRKPLTIPLALNYTLPFDQRRAELIVAIQVLQRGQPFNLVKSVEVY